MNDLRFTFKIARITSVQYQALLKKTKMMTYQILEQHIKNSIFSEAAKTKVLTKAGLKVADGEKGG